MKRTLCIRLVGWPVQRLTVARPELKGKPLVLWETYRGGRRVAVCSAEAGALGVTAAMPLAEASVLVGSNRTTGGTTLHREPYDPVADREALEELAECCRQFSPLVGLENTPNPDSIFLDVTGLGHLFGDESSLAAKVAEEFAHRRLITRIAVADTIGAAWAVTHFRVQGSGVGVQDPTFTARRSECIDGDLAVNNNSLSTTYYPLLTILPPGQTSPALRPLPIEALRLPAEVVDLLHQLGIYRVGQFESLPREDLTSRFGHQAVRRLDQSTGRLAESITAKDLPPELEAELVLEHPTTRRAAIEIVLEQLIEQVARVLARSGRGAMRLGCRLDCQAADSVDLSVGLFKATASVRHLAGLVKTRLQRVSLPGPVLSVHVRAVSAAPLEYRQEELFSDDRYREDPRRLAGLVDRLSSRLGRRSVGRARLLNDAQPELSYRYDPLVGGPSARRRGGPARDRKSGLPPRPLCLDPRPTRLAATSIMPDGPPLRFQLADGEHCVSRFWGPERIETGWWRGRPVGRDYYRVETTTGRRFWLFRRLRDGDWFLHGVFE